MTGIETPHDPALQSGVSPPGSNSGDAPRSNSERLWDELSGDEADGGRRVLIVEACRIVDRLDRLDALLEGTAEDWLRIAERNGSDEIVEIQIDKPLAEARQQATALKQILAELRQAQPAGRVGTQRPPTQAETGKGGVVADLSARLAARSARPTG